ncbi:short chain dehydrogenase [Corynebacterium glutamicum MT]|uniref:Short-chain dehydrogenase/reductase n=3 Tax=Corynebacterium glutamicum TaxID=1718 RepID=A0AB36IIM8_CORGT|nr:oxidoreductase [Corynebacterium glutamicum]AGN18770.1 short chain dehydrogenase [Corynebacterium glutamicum SCgG1]AGN21793.1 short chain dehydrogenase [Corynebacterium glutamicum SCgG2]EGV40123.1 short chain dehydrogenase [Corynebacterium glutamicum S9114]EOA65099.1 short chain dehydrogenase [Corynebacterium glutamicum MT]EPP41123.1 short chain dehydrogenase [Corynebacterium glutamicum Z188]
MPTKVALVTGASSGIGESTARKLQSLGFTVYGATRRTERLQKLASDGIHPLEMDVTDDESMKARIAKILADSGRIDVLVNNAGYGSYGAIEDVSIDEGGRQFEVNVFGAMALTRLVLPHMRKQKSGTIVNITSMGGKIYTPLGGWYHGTKFALEALSDALRLEVAQFGIDVVVIEPGGIATEWGGIAADNLDAVSKDSAYKRQADAVSKSLRSEANSNRNSPPSVVADAIGKAVTARHPKTRYAIGFGAKPLIAARNILTDRQFDAVITRATGVPRD